MEQLVSVELLAENCQSCLKSFLTSDDSSSQVTSELQDIFRTVFHDLINEVIVHFFKSPIFILILIHKLADGKICQKCLSHLKAFKSFKDEIMLSRKKILLRFQQVDDIRKTDPFTSIMFEENEADNINDINKRRNVKAAYDHQSVPKQIQKSKETKVQQLLKKHDVSFVKDDIGKPTKTRKVLCPICSKILALSSFPNHLKGHEGGREYNFTCEICAKRCVSNIELVVHRRFSTNFRSKFCNLFLLFILDVTLERSLISVIVVLRASIAKRISSIISDIGI